MNTLQKINLGFASIVALALLYLLMISRIPELEFLYVVIAGCIWISAVAVYSSNRRLIWIAYSAILLFTTAPVMSFSLAYFIAAIFGATLNEGNVHPYLLGGYDLGPLLYSMSVHGWLMLITLPAGIILILALTLSLVAAKWLDSRSKTPSGAKVLSNHEDEI